MRTLTDDERKNWRTIQSLAFVFGIMTPTVLLLAVHYGVKTAQPATGGDLLFYVLLILGAFQPALAMVVERSWKRPGNAMTARMPAWLRYLNLSLVRFAMYEAIFLYGFVVYLVTKDFNRMLWFYPIGVIWVVMYWPRKRAYETFIEETEKNNVNRT